jgi:4-amino-4-deoxy-L-arabinose transferase-like glycosyltransferase
LTPVAVAVDRSNNTDTLLVLTLLLAEWALTRAIETGRLSLLLLSAVLVGVGFNVKMLVAFGAVPVFVLLYLAAARISWRQRIAHLAASGAVLATVSLSWTGIYDLIPPQNRPFVDSTRDNSMLELVVGHNGIQRFVRRARVLPSTAQVDAAPTGASTTGAAAAPAAGLPPARDYAPAGSLRLAAPHLAAQMGWLFPLAVIGGLAAWGRSPTRWPLERRHLSLALWAGWTLCYGAVFSAAGGLFHAYYLVAMAPALSALAGIGIVGLWSLGTTGGTTSLLFPATVAATALWQGYIVNAYLTDYLAIGERWLVPTVIGMGGLTAAALVLLRHAPSLFGGVALLSLLALPTAWSIGTVLVKGNTGFPAARPPFLNDAAETQRRRWSMVAGALGGDPKLIDFLRSNRRSEEYLLAAVNARQAAPIIIATGEPIMALGGFSGRDPILTVDGFARLVEDDRVRFALIGDGSPACTASSGKMSKSPWSTGSRKTDVRSIPLDGEPRCLMALRATAPPKLSGHSSTICVLLRAAAD